VAELIGLQATNWGHLGTYYWLLGNLIRSLGMSPNLSFYLRSKAPLFPIKFDINLTPTIINHLLSIVTMIIL
jgi:hypothetical protein